MDSPTTPTSVPVEPEPTSLAPPEDAELVNEIDEAPLIAASPLEQAFGLLLDPEILSAQYGVAYDRFTDDVTRCMRQAGFEYTERPFPVPPPDDFRLVQSQTELGSIYRIGYTLSENLSRAINPERAEAIPEDAITVQNRETVQSLSGSDRDIFRHTRADCYEQAGEGVALPDDMAPAIAEEIDQVRVAAQSSPAMLALWMDWSSCMAGQGFLFTNRLDAVDSLVPESRAIWSLLASEGETPAAINAVIEFAAKEAELVAIDISCSEQINLLEREQQARHSFETEWLENNGDRVNLLLQEAESGP